MDKEKLRYQKIYRWRALDINFRPDVIYFLFKIIKYLLEKFDIIKTFAQSLQFLYLKHQKVVAKFIKSSHISIRRQSFIWLLIYHIICVWNFEVIACVHVSNYFCDLPVIERRLNLNFRIYLNRVLSYYAQNIFLLHLAIELNCISCWIIHRHVKNWKCFRKLQNR